MGGVIGLGKHGIASSLEIIWLAALLVLMVTGVKGVGTLAGVDFTRTRAHQRCKARAWPEAPQGKERIWRHRIRGRVASSRRSTMRSEEHTSELQSRMRYSYAVFCLKK